MNPVHDSFPQAIIFILASAAFFFFPGSLALRFAGVQLDGLPRFSGSWLIGYLVTSLLYYLTGLLKVPFLFLPGMVFFLPAYFYCCFFSDIKRYVRSLKSLDRWGFFYFFLAIFVVFYHWTTTHHWTVWGPQGLDLFSDHYSDNLLGPACAAEMKHNFPPENPLFAGQRLLYQYFPYIGLAIFSKFFSMPLLPLAYYYFPILSRLILILILISASREIFLKNHIRAIAVLLAFLLSIAGIKIGYGIGFSLFFCGLIFLMRYLKQGHPRELIGMALLWGALVSHLTILSLIVCLSVTVWIFIQKFLRNITTKQGLSVVAALALSSFLWMGLSFGFPGAKAGHAPVLQFKNQVKHHVRNTLYTFSPKVYEFWLAQRDTMAKTPSQIMTRELDTLHYSFVIGIWLIAILSFLINVLNFAIVGFLNAILSFMRSNRQGPSAESLLKTAGVLGIAMAFFFSPQETSSPVIFFQFASVLLLFTSAPFLNDLYQSHGRWFLKIFVSLFLVYAFSYHMISGIVGFDSTLKFHTRTSLNLIDAYDFLKKQSPPNAVIMHSLIDEKIYSTEDPSKNWVYPGHNYYLAILAERRSLFIHPTLAPSLAVARLPGNAEERQRDIRTFFTSRDPNKAEAILKKYGAVWVLTTPETSLKFPHKGFLKSEFKNDDAEIFRRFTN